MPYAPRRSPSIRLLVPVLIIALAVPLMGKRKVRVPKDQPLSVATQRRLENAQALSDRTAEDWVALEQRYELGQVTRKDIIELRINWAAAGSPLYSQSEWPLRLIDDGVPSHTAVQLSSAVWNGDLERIDSVIEDLATAPPPPGPELRLVQVAANWGLGREGRAAVIYREVRDSGGIFLYYDATLEDWLRHRATELRNGEPPAYDPPDAAKVEALRKEFHERGVPGQFLLFFLETPDFHAASPRVGTLDDAVIEELFDHHKVDWYFCYEREGGVEDLGAGSLSFDFGVDPYGHVEFCSVRPGGELRNSTLRGCCCDVIEQIRFPIPDGGGMAASRYELGFPIKP